MAKKKIELTKAKVLEIKPKGRYLVILDKKDAGTERELTELNEGLKTLFGKTQVLAIFVKDVNTVKIAELMEEVDNE